MASQRSKFTVGLFVTGGIVIALVAVIALGMSRILEKGQYYIAYFDESVQGLSRDSAVKYRGVSVGRVVRIEVAPDAKLIQVVLKIETELAIDKSLVAQLKTVGITGSMFVELDRTRPGQPDRTPPLSFPSEYPIIASKPSDISEILRGIDEALAQIKSLDLPGISEKFKLTLDTANGLLQQADISRVSENFNTVLVSADRDLVKLEQIIARFDGILADKEQHIRLAIDDARGAMRNANELLAKGNTIMSGTDAAVLQVRQQMLTGMRNLERATENLNALIDSIADHPAGVLFGGPPERREVEGE